MLGNMLYHMAPWPEKGYRSRFKETTAKTKIKENTSQEPYYITWDGKYGGVHGKWFHTIAAAELEFDELTKLGKNPRKAVGWD